MRATLRLRGLALSALISFITRTTAWKFHNPNLEPDYILRATAKNVTINCESRYSVVINGTSPGPPLYMEEGKTTWIRVYNDIPNDNLTVHWHGLSQRAAPFSDGSPQASQWPIAPLQFFDYEVHPEAGDAGTYFYHSHIGFQSITAHGALIVKDCGKPAYRYDEDLIITISDYYNKTDSQVVDGLLASPFHWSGETNALLFNGQSGTSSLSNATDASCAPAVITVKPNTLYRIRSIGMTAISLVTFGIEDHDNMTIIEADGADTKPFTKDHLEVASGQRFSFLLKTKSADELAALQKTSFFIQFENRDRPANVSGYAILSYDTGSQSQSQSLPQSLPSSPPLKLPQQINDYLEYSLEPHESERYVFPAKPTRTVVIQMNQIGPYVNKTFTKTLEWEQNGNVWQEEKVPKPYLISIYENGQLAIPDYETALKNGGWDPVTRLFPAKVGEVLDIVWQSNNSPSGGFDIHPMHAHGGHYWDLGSGNGTYNATKNEKRLEGYTPVLRDTTMLYRYATTAANDTTLGWRAWRINVSDPGIWMMHCHILQHMIMGMQTVWAFGDAKEILAEDEVYVSGYLAYGGSAYGNASFDPLVTEYFPKKSEGYPDHCQGPRPYNNSHKYIAEK